MGLVVLNGIPMKASLKCGHTCLRAMSPALIRNRNLFSVRRLKLHKGHGLSFSVPRLDHYQVLLSHR